LLFDQVQRELFERWFNSKSVTYEEACELLDLSYATVQKWLKKEVPFQIRASNWRKFLKNSQNSELIQFEEGVKTFPNVEINLFKKGGSEKYEVLGVSKDEQFFYTIHKLKDDSMFPNFKKGEYAVILKSPTLKFGPDGHSNFSEKINPNKIYSCQLYDEGVELRRIRIENDTPLIDVTDSNWRDKHFFPVPLRPESKLEIYGEVVAKGIENKNNRSKTLNLASLYLSIFLFFSGLCYVIADKYIYINVLHEVRDIYVDEIEKESEEEIRKKNTVDKLRSINERIDKMWYWQFLKKK